MKNRFLTKEEVTSLFLSNKFKLVLEDSFKIDKEDILLLNRCSQEYGFSIDKSLIREGKEENKDKDSYSAIIFIIGNYSIKPDLFIESEYGKEHINLYVENKTLTNYRLKQLANKIFSEKKVELFKGCDQEYLYEVLSETKENIIFESLKKVSSGSPIYNIVFEDKGDFKVEQQGNV